MAKRSALDEREPNPSDGNGDRRGLVEQQIYDHALTLFAERGYASTSLQDIADSMGTSRPKLYYYVSTKEDILARLVEDVTGAGARATIALQQAEGAPEVRLQMILEHMINSRLDDPLRFRVLDRCEAELPAEIATKHLAGKRAFLNALTEVLAEGMTAGTFRPGDERVAAFALIGMSNWVAWWYVPGRSGDRAAIGRQLVDTAMTGVLRPSRSAGNPSSVINRMHEELDVLSRMLRGDASPAD